MCERELRLPPSLPEWTEMKAKIVWLREALEYYASCSDGCTCGDGWNHTVAIDALSKAAEAGGRDE